MRGNGESPTVSQDRLACSRLPGAVLAAAAPPVAAPDGGTLRVTVVGADTGQRRRLVELLARTAGIEVQGWADSPQALAALDSCAELGVVIVEPAPALPRPERRRPRLAARQREVMIAYAGSNDLVKVVARRLAMRPETLKTHLRRIRAKYEEVGRPARTRRDLYVLAVQDGLLPPPTRETGSGTAGTGPLV